MLRLRALLVFLCIFADCVTRARGVIEVFGYLGRNVTVSCPYSRGYEAYEKYLCKNDCGNNDVLITTSGTSKGRLSISDDRKSLKFMVTISNLRSTDAGKYWCGVTRSGKDLYTEVKLHVTQDSCCTDVIQIQSYEEDSVSITCQYAKKYQPKLKFICRGTQPSTCLQQAVVTSEETSNGRFTLTDDQTSGKFTATISRLTQKDSGRYLCGVHSSTGRFSFDAAHLEVKEWCCIASTSNITGTEGQAVTLRCPYPPQHQDNRKFLCKGDHRNNCTDVVTNRSRFTLHEDVSSSSFSVMVSKLEAGDAGTYWCGSDSQWRVGNYTKIELSVFLQHDQHDKSISVFTGKPTSVIVFIAVFGAITVVLVLTITWVIFKHKCHKKQEAEVLEITNIPKPADVEEEMRPDVYSNQEFIRQVKQSSCCHDDFNDDQPEYGNIIRTEEIYCNQNVFRANVQ